MVGVVEAEKLSLAAEILYLRIAREDIARSCFALKINNGVLIKPVLMCKSIF